MENSDEMKKLLEEKQEKSELYDLQKEQVKSLRFFVGTEAILVIVTLVLAFVILMAFFQARKMSQQNTVVIPTASPISHPSITVDKTPSEYSKSERFQKFEKDRNQLDQDSNQVDLSESKLSFPFLDMNVNFRK